MFWNVALCHCPEGLLFSPTCSAVWSFLTEISTPREKKECQQQSIRHAPGNASPHMDQELEDPSCD